MLFAIRVVEVILESVQRCEQIIWTADGYHKTQIYNNSLFEKHHNLVSLLRICAPLYTESTSFCEHNFGNEKAIGNSEF